jgi:hypothetical protein
MLCSGARDMVLRPLRRRAEPGVPLQDRVPRVLRSRASSAAAAPVILVVVAVVVIIPIVVAVAPLQLARGAAAVHGDANRVRGCTGLAAESASAATDAALHAGPGIVFAGGVVRVGGYAVALVGGEKGGMGVAYRLPLGRAG